LTDLFLKTLKFPINFFHGFTYMTQNSIYNMTNLCKRAYLKCVLETKRAPSMLI
jgi:hypothetical protein